jgi:hypothetical protein
MPGYTSWRIDITKYPFDINTEFYLCWKPETVQDIIEKLTLLGFKRVYFEKF